MSPRPFFLCPRLTPPCVSAAPPPSQELGQNPTDKEFFEVVSTVDREMKGLIGEEMLPVPGKSSSKAPNCTAPPLLFMCDLFVRTVSFAWARRMHTRQGLGYCFTHSRENATRVCSCCRELKRFSPGCNKLYLSTTCFRVLRAEPMGHLVHGLLYRARQVEADVTFPYNRTSTGERVGWD